MNTLKNLIKHSGWKKIKQEFSAQAVANGLSFMDGLRLSKQMLEDPSWDDEVQTFAIELIEAVSERYFEEWSTNWKYDAYLGYSYDLRGWDYEKQFAAYQSAAQKSLHPDPEVLMRMAINWSYPGVYKALIDESQAICLLEKAMSEQPYIEGVSRLVNLCAEIGDAEKEAFWKRKLEECEQQERYAPYHFLDFFSDFRNNQDV